MAELAEITGKLSHLTQEGNGIFETARQRGNGELKMTDEELTRVRAINAECTDLRKQYESLKETLGIEDSFKSIRTALGQPGPFEYPGEAGDQNNGGRKRGAGGVAFRTLGELFIESDAFKKYDRTQKRSPSVSIDFAKLYGDGVRMRDALGLGAYGAKALLDTTGFAPEAVRIPRIVPGALRRPVVADLIPQGETSQNAIPYMEETTTTNAAAAVAEGAAKPESALAFTERSSPVRKIATVLPVTDELFDDAPAMRSYVEARLRLFLELAEESQLYSGSGVAPQLTGLVNTSGILTQAKGADSVPAAVYKAMTKIRTTAFLEPSGIIMHPNDWQDVRLLTTTDGIFIWGPPSADVPEVMWGVPVVATPAATENTALVGAYDQATQIFRRSDVTFAVSDQHSDFFVNNKLMLRVEERLALVVYRPSGLCTVTGI